MGRIRRLDPQVIDQIAAGEVVERPASVVKELVENSLDAGARRIRIAVEAGGLRSIVVADDGCGMDPEDAVLALERHATSKITRLADLAHAGTLGFRGEALAAIASVARVELLTRPADAEAGYRVVVEGGTRRSAGPWASPPGTRVTVRDLFFNTPARRKHLRGPAVEFGRIADVVTAHALARPEVRFELWHDGRPVLQTSGSGDRAVVVLECFGPDVAAALIPVAARRDGYRVEGYVGAPRVARASRAWQFFSINRRPVQVASLRFSLENAYRHLLPARRHPLAVIEVALPGDEVDVNVHPAKLEVRLVRERAVAGLLYEAVREALATRDLVRPAGEPERSGGRPGARGTGHGVGRPSSPRFVRGATWAGPGAWTGAEGGAGGDPAGGAASPCPGTAGPCRAGAGPAPGALPGPAAAAAERPGAYGTPASVEAWVEVFGRHLEPAGGAPAAPSGAPAPPEAAAAPVGGADAADGRDLLRRLQPLGQVVGTYLACAGPDGLYLVDQHAAHERIYFERFLREGGAPGGVPAQVLAVPVVVDLPPSEAALLVEHAATVARLGFRVEPFGPRSVVVRAVPAALADRPTAALLTDLLSRLLTEAVGGDGDQAAVGRRRHRPGADDGGGAGAPDPARGSPADGAAAAAEPGRGPGGSPAPLAALDTERAARILAACKAAIKAGDRLHPREMAQLLADLAACQQPYACPHGRPTVIRLGVEELERRFGRRGGG
ncbi:MAG TPA: DNA mismatch repair endonuclease MutL [Thermaerobacter sp.]